MFLSLALISFWTAASRAALPSRIDTDEGPFQYVPAHQTTPDNHFNDPSVADPKSEYFLTEAGVNPDVVYQSRAFDIPFAMLNQGNLKFFERGQLNWPAATNSSQYKPGINDYASNSACGIPDNAWNVTKVAIHPYWLKYAPADLGLSRFCMQDVCISIWNETGAGGSLKGTTDVEVKVTDICSTNSSDPNFCATPTDIMIDRAQGHKLYHFTNKTEDQIYQLKHGKQYPRPVWWFFSKCLQDGLPQKAYNHSSNWFANPPLPCNTKWSMSAIQVQQENNLRTYPQHGLPYYQMGAYKTVDAERPLFRFPIENDWHPGDPEPSWCPVAGGKGHGHPTGSCDQHVEK